MWRNKPSSITWEVLKNGLKAERNESVTNCHQLKLTFTGDGKKYLTDILYKAWSDMSAKEYKKFKGLTKENLWDNMTNKELVLNMLAELSTKEISESREPDTFAPRKRKFTSL